MIRITNYSILRYSLTFPSLPLGLTTAYTRATAPMAAAATATSEPSRKLPAFPLGIGRVLVLLALRVPLPELWTIDRVAGAVVEGVVEGVVDGVVLLAVVACVDGLAAVVEGAMEGAVLVSATAVYVVGPADVMIIGERSEDEDEKPVQQER
jgi:hypothetical protein